MKEAKIVVIAGNQKPVLNAMKSLKLCKRQTQRLVDILLCLEALKSGNIAHLKYLEEIKKRMKNDMMVI